MSRRLGKFKKFEVETIRRNFGNVIHISETVSSPKNTNFVIHCRANL